MAIQHFRSRATNARMANEAGPVPQALAGVGTASAESPRYPTEAVPGKAKEVASWLAASLDDADARARAAVAHDVEQSRDEPRQTVIDAVARILG